MNDDGRTDSQYRGRALHKHPRVGTITAPDVLSLAGNSTDSATLRVPCLRPSSKEGQSGQVGSTCHPQLPPTSKMLNVDGYKK